MTWDGGQLSKATIHSTIGGNLRIRSYIPLKGEGVKAASGSNQNPLFQTAEIKTPLVSKDITPQQPMLYKIYEYDIFTEPGKDYALTR
jgi:alpha-L-fucosidase 2